MMKAKANRHAHTDTHTHTLMSSCLHEEGEDDARLEQCEMLAEAVSRPVDERLEGVRVKLGLEPLRSVHVGLRPQLLVQVYCLGTHGCVRVCVCVSVCVYIPCVCVCVCLCICACVCLCPMVGSVTQLGMPLEARVLTDLDVNENLRSCGHGCVSNDVILESIARDDGDEGVDTQRLLHQSGMMGMPETRTLTSVCAL